LRPDVERTAAGDRLTSRQTTGCGQSWRSRAPRREQALRKAVGPRRVTGRAAGAAAKSACSPASASTSSSGSTSGSRATLTIARQKGLHQRRGGRTPAHLLHQRLSACIAQLLRYLAAMADSSRPRRPYPSGRFSRGACAVSMLASTAAVCPLTVQMLGQRQQAASCPACLPRGVQRELLLLVDQPQNRLQVQAGQRRPAVSGPRS
jgi:hypothetical protein